MTEEWAFQKKDRYLGYKMWFFGGSMLVMSGLAYILRSNNANQNFAYPLLICLGLNLCVMFMEFDVTNCKWLP